LRDKRLQKLERHFAVLCNGAKVNILNYHLKREADGSLVLELITKIRSPVLSQGVVEFEMNDSGALHFSGKWMGEFHQPNVTRYYYLVKQQLYPNEEQVGT
jgi:hypothetical protein